MVTLLKRLESRLGIHHTSLLSPPRAHFAPRAQFLANNTPALFSAAKMDTTPLSRADSLPLAALLGAVDVVSPRRAAQAAALAAA